VSDVIGADGIGPRPELIGTFEQLRGELERLRIRAARGSGKPRLSLRDLSAASGIPRTTLANYFSGASVIPADQLDALVLALGTTPEGAAAWASAWERAMEHRLGGEAGSEPPAASTAQHGQPPAYRTNRGGRRWLVGGLALLVAVAAGTVGYRLLTGPQPHRVAEASMRTAPGCWPVTGDWNGDRRTTAGTACKNLRDLTDHGLPWAGTNMVGGGRAESLGGFGNSDYCLPVTGDWDGDGRTTVGVACRNNASPRMFWALINSLNGGSPSYPRFTFGGDGCWPVTGDWNGDGRTSVGSACRERGRIRWTLTDSLAEVEPAYPSFDFGDAAACWPVTGDWNGDGRTSVGAACRDGDRIRWELTNALSGGAVSYPAFDFGDFASCRPVTGDWNGDRTSTAGVACYTAAGIRWDQINAHAASAPSYPPFVLGNTATFQPSGGWRGPAWPGG
jgi:hypothetical protein